MRINAYPDTCSRSGEEVMRAFMEGLDGVRPMQGREITQCDCVVMWSLLYQFNPDRQFIFETYRSMGIPVIVLEVGVLDRGRLWKVGLNGINALAQFPRPHSNTRWDRIGRPLRPYRRDGRSILVCGQNARSGAWLGGEMNLYMMETIEEIRSYTDRPIVVRPHPRYNLSLPVDMQHPVRIDTDVYDFVQSLDDVWAVVSANSNPGVESIIEGIPVCVDQSSLAAPVGNIIADIENPFLYEREEWANTLAHTEWSLDEIRDGIPWAALREFI